MPRHRRTAGYPSLRTAPGECIIGFVPSKPYAERDPFKRFLARHRRVVSAVYCCLLAYVVARSAGFLWRDRTTVASGWDAAVAAGALIPLAVAVIWFLAAYLRSASVLLAARIATVIVGLGSFPPLIAALDGRATATALWAGAFAMAIPGESVLAAFFAWAVIRPWVRWLTGRF